MIYNQTSRNKLYNSFLEKHQPDKLLCFSLGAEGEDIFKAFTSLSFRYMAKDKKILEQMSEEYDKSNFSPAEFFKKKYKKLVSFCAGTKDEEKLLYAYFDKINQFPYTTGWERRTVRTKKYINPIYKIREILYTAYYMQLYSCSLGKILLNEMSEELIDYKNYDDKKGYGLEDLIAAHLDGGDIETKEALIQIITGENNRAFLSISMIRGIIKSNDQELHRLLGQLLVAARLEEGLRQAICENMDCGTIAAFRIIFDVIDEHDLLRFSAVRRAVGTWIGMLDTEHLKRSSDKTFSIMKAVLHNRNVAYEFLESEDAMSILTGLWGLGFYEVDDASKEMCRIAQKGSIQQKRVAAYYNNCLGNTNLQYKFANMIIESNSLDMSVLAAIKNTYMQGCRMEAGMASGMRFGMKPENKKPVNLKIWFRDEREAERHLIILISLLNEMDKKKYEFKPFLFPWYQAELTKSDVLIWISVLANGLQREELMDQLAERIPEFAADDNSRVAAVQLLLTGAETAKRKEILIRTLGDKETYTRNTAFAIAKNTEFSPEEYDKICSLLRFKSAELRMNLMALIRKQDNKGLGRSLQYLLTDKKEEVRLAGLDMVQILIKESLESSNKKEGKERLIESGKELIRSISNPTEREQIIIKEILGTKEEDLKEEEALFSESDQIPVPEILCDKNKYPLFSITEKRLQELFSKLDKTIDEYKNYEITTPYGETVLLGNERILPQLKLEGTVEEQYPLVPVWKEFYEKEIGNKQDLVAMLLAITPYAVSFGYGSKEEISKEYNKYIKTVVSDIFGKVIIDFDAAALSYAEEGTTFYYSGNEIYKDILSILIELYCDKRYQYELGRDVAKYLCNYVAANKKRVKVESNPNLVIANGTLVVTPLNVQILSVTVNDFCKYWTTKEDFVEKFHIIRYLEHHYYGKAEKEFIFNGGYREKIAIRAVDYVAAAQYGLITERQMYCAILNSDRLRAELQDLFYLYKKEKYPYWKEQEDFHFLMKDEELKQYVKKTADVIANEIVSVECKRGDSPTDYSHGVTAIEIFYGAEHLIRLLTAMGKDKFVRNDGFYWSGNGSKPTNLSYLVSVCHPGPKDTIESFCKIVKAAKISEKRLIETAMYAPQWIDYIEAYLGWNGLKSGAYYFMAHMNDIYNRDERKYAIIARYTPLEKDELLHGAFDIEWFEEAYKTLGEERFYMLYDAAKYICDGSKHSRARKYADAALGKMKLQELECEIKEKRNKDLVMSYPLLPLVDQKDLLHRYEFIQNFRKEGRQFGAQRRNSENLACDMALRNLAMRAGFQDVTRLILVMEMTLTDSVKQYLEWTELGSDKNLVEARIEIPAVGRPEIVFRKDGKMLSSIPGVFKKHEYILSLKEINKKFRDQYSRTVKMFELSMEEKEKYTVEEICKLRKNPVIRNVVENMIFVQDESKQCGVLSSDEKDYFVDVEGKKLELSPVEKVRIAHPFDFYRSGNWSRWQKLFFEKQKEYGIKQPFRQVFRELYVKLDEEQGQPYSRMFAGHQIQPSKTVAILKGRRWIADEEAGLEKVYYKDDIVVTMYALADWFSPADIEPPILEYVAFANRKTKEPVKMEDIPDIIYSEAMRDVDLAVSVAHAGNVDPEASHSTIEMRKVIVAYNIELFKLENVYVKGTHAFIKGSRGEYTVHLGSGVIHMQGVHQLHVLPVHSQHRGKIFLPFLDEDPKTAEIISKIILFANDKKIKDPYILDQMK